MDEPARRELDEAILRQIATCRGTPEHPSPSWRFLPTETALPLASRNGCTAAGTFLGAARMSEEATEEHTRPDLRPPAGVGQTAPADATFEASCLDPESFIAAYGALAG